MVGGYKSRAAALACLLIHVSMWRSTYAQETHVSCTNELRWKLPRLAHLFPNSSHTWTANSAGRPATAALRPLPSTVQRLAAGRAGRTRSG